MVLEYVLPAADRDAFLGCRRAWDLGARERGNLEPRKRRRSDPLGEALRAALAVYYFPGMWDWQPHVVLRLVRTAFLDVLPEPAGEPGLALLEAYFHWAPEVDEMSPAVVSGEVDVRVPDPVRPGRDLVAPGDRAVHYRDRFDLLAIDAANRYWMVEHRFTTGEWHPPELLLLEERCLSWCWAYEQAHPGMRIEGTVFNELRTDARLAREGPASPERRGSLPQSGHSYVRPWSSARSGDPASDPGPAPPDVRASGTFRRVRVERSHAEIAGFGERLAAQVGALVDPEVARYPTPSPARCARCDFRTPCLAMNVGIDPSALLAAGYTERSHEPVPGQLGGRTWSTGRGAAPPSFGDDRRGPGR